MGEAFRQGMYTLVGGILFCIASAILVLIFTGLVDMDRNIHTAHEVAYDNIRGYRFEDTDF